MLILGGKLTIDEDIEVHVDKACGEPRCVTGYALWYEDRKSYHRKASALFEGEFFCAPPLDSPNG